MWGETSAQLASSLDNDAFIDQGVFFAISSFLMFECRLAHPGSKKKQDGCKQFFQLVAVLVPTFFYLPFVYVPFQPDSFGIVYKGAYKGMPFLVLILVSTFVTTSFVPLAYYLAIFFQILGAILQLLRYAKIGDSHFTSAARVSLMVAMSLSLRASSRFVNEIGSNRQILLTVLSTAAQVALVFEYELWWAAVSIAHIVVTLEAVIMYSCTRESTGPKKCPEMKKEVYPQPHVGKIKKCKKMCKNIVGKIGDLLLEYMAALEVIPHVIMIGCTDTMLLIVISKQAGEYGGWIGKNEEFITVASQAVVMAVSGGMRFVYSGRNLQRYLTGVQTTMFILLIAMSFLLIKDVATQTLLRLILIGLVEVVQAFVALPLTIETLQQEIGGKENKADACRYALAGWRFLAVWSFSYLSSVPWLGRSGAFTLIFIIPYAISFVVQYADPFGPCKRLILTFFYYRFVQDRLPSISIEVTRLNQVEEDPGPSIMSAILNFCTPSFGRHGRSDSRFRRLAAFLHKKFSRKRDNKEDDIELLAVQGNDIEDDEERC